MNEITPSEFDEFLELLKNDKCFVDVTYTNDGMVIISGKGFGWAMMRADEYEKSFEKALKEYLKKL